MSLGRQAPRFLSCCRNTLKILNPCEQESEFQPCQTDSATFEQRDKCPGAMSDPGKCRAITVTLLTRQAWGWGERLRFSLPAFQFVLCLGNYS